MLNLKLAFRTLFKTPFVTMVAILSLASRHRRQCGDLLDVRSDAAADAARPRAGPARESRSPGPKPGSQHLQQRRRLRQRRSVTRCSATSNACRRFSPASPRTGCSRQPRVRRPDDERQTACSYRAATSPCWGFSRRWAGLLGPGDDRTVGESRVVVLAHAYWLTRFGGRPDVLNKTIIVNGQSMTVVGVAPRGFDGTTLGCEARGLRARSHCAS